MSRARPADGTEWELPGLDDLELDEILAVMRQCRPGAVVTYPDGSRYKMAWKPHRFYTCEASGMLWRVMASRPTP